MLKTEMPKDNIKAYQEACNAIRHYSNFSYGARVFAVVQGFILFSAWTVNFNNLSKWLLLGIPIFGLLFTFLSFLFFDGYFFAANFFYKVASRMEDRLFDEGFRPIKEYDIQHDLKYKHWHAKAFVLYAPFTLTFLLFMIMLGFTLIDRF